MKKTMMRLTLVTLYFVSIGAAFADGEMISQNTMTEDVCRWYAKQDAQLNAMYQQVLEKHTDEKAWQQRLRHAQRAWLTFRDAELALTSPLGQSLSTLPRGTTASMCRCIKAGQLTTERIAQLKALLRPMEGDVCTAP